MPFVVVACEGYKGASPSTGSLEAEWTDAPFPVGMTDSRRNPDGRRTARGRLLPVAVAVVLLGAVAAAFITVRHNIANQNHRLLQERTGEVGLLLQSAVTELPTSLRPLGVAATLAGPTSPEFLREARAVTAAAPTESVAFVEQRGVGFTIVSASGLALTKGQTLTGAPATAARKAQTTPGVVSTPIFHPAGASFVGFALGPPVTRPGSAIYLQVPIDPAAAASAPVTRSQPFNELDVALYVGARPDSRQLALATAPAPLTGDVAYRRISVGGRRWTLAASARRPLVGSFANAVPWIILGVGLSSAALAIATIFLLQRRRDYAVRLVAERTAELRTSMRELESTQARLMFQERLATIGQVAAAVGHELRNPLGVLTNALYLVRSALPNGPDARVTRNLDTAEREIGAMVIIVESMLDFARDREPQMDRVNLAELVDESLSVAPAPPGIEVVRVGLDELPPVEADRQQLRQVLLNLISNGYEAMTDGGVLTVEAEATDDRFAIRVSDTGSGMDEETANHVFDAFYTRKAKGIGLGLAVSKRIVDAHGGAITTESAVGVGTTFSVTMPRVRVPAEVPS
jgi:signal transduction histidine kinase